MADNFRSRDPQGRAGAADSLSDPLAELARLIGERTPRAAATGDALRQPGRYDDTPPTSGVEWVAGDDTYADPVHDGREAYAAPSSDGAAWAHERDLDDGHGEAPAVRQYADPAPPFDDFPDHDERRAPAFDAQSPRYEPPEHEPYPPDNHPHYAAQEQDNSSDAEEEYEHDRSAPRRSGTILILAVLGLAVLGTAGAFGYKAMFGNSMVSGLVPLIKPDDKPIKIQPSQDKQASKPGQSETADKGAGEHLVEHQEQPVDVQSANPPVPRVVNTIPVVSNAPFPGALPPADAMPAAPPPQPIAFPAVQAPPPAANLPAAQAPQPAIPGPASSGAKPVHTVIIRAGQPANANANPVPVAAPPAAHAAKPREQAPRELRQTAKAGGPLSIMPSPGGDGHTRAPDRTHVAMRTPAPPPPEATSTAGGGYSVQVSSQRSEAEAEAAFRSLQAKYPQELGSHRPMVRRADLGAKGVYYRALVGPFASGEQATELCSKLKAAGGSCILQRN
jgi:hypothetical protein